MNQLNEVAPSQAFSSIENHSNNNSQNSNSPNDIHIPGYYFNNYKDDEFFTDEKGNDIRAIDFLKRYYDLAKAKGWSTQDAKNGMFYFLYPAEKKFKIPETYQKLKFKKKLPNGQEITKVRPLSRYVALDILLTDIFCGFEKSYNVALTDNKSAPLLKIFREKPLVDDEGIINKLNTENKSLFKENRLFEYILQEANKDRFLSKLYELYGDIKENYDLNLAAQFLYCVTQNDLDINNYYEPLLAFVNSNSADKYKFNWQQKDKKGLYKNIIEAFISYLENGTRNQRKKLAKQEPKMIFYNSGLNVVESGEDCSGADFIILNELEDNNFLYLGVLTHSAAVFCDSFYCGGIGARWCIGTKDKPQFFEEYIKRSIFVLAFNKNSIAKQKKFMFEFQIGRRPQIWNQMDEAYKEIELIDESLADGKKILEIFINNVAPYTTVYSNLLEISSSAEEYINAAVLSNDGVIYYRNILNDVFPKADLLESYRSNAGITIDFEDEDIENIFGSKNNSLEEIFLAIADKIGIDLISGEENLNITFKNLRTKRLVYNYSFDLGYLGIVSSNIGEFIYDKSDNSRSGLNVFFLRTTIYRVILAKGDSGIKCPSMLGLFNAGLIGEVVTR